MLKFKIGTEDFEKLNDVEKTFYAQSDDGYQLQVEGATDKSKVDDFRNKNIELMNAAEKFKGVDMDKYRKLEEQESKLLDAKFIDTKDFEGMKAEHYKVRDADWTAKNEVLSNENTELKRLNSKIVSKYEIEGAATKAFGEHKINPAAFESIMAQIKAKFSVDNHQVIAKEGETILAGADGNLTVSEFVASQPEIFKLQSNGGNGKGNDSEGAPMKAGTSSQDKIRAGLAARMKP